MKTTATIPSESFRWFREARFGMFIHWGLYSLLGRGEWVMFEERIPPEQYAALAARFHPRRYDPRAWARLAREAGMKYMVLTTRHHDGFCLFDTKTTDFNSVQTAVRRDLVAEYVTACREAGLKVGLYYSLAEWRCPLFWKKWTLTPARMTSEWHEMVARAHAQVEELCRNYGRIDLLWYDGGFCPRGVPLATAYRGRQLDALVRRLQPHIVINNRAGLRGDFDTPEQHVTASPPGRLWEACVTLNKHWGYFRDDNLWKSPREIIQHWLTAAACGGGNCLLNIGPTAAGRIPPASVSRLKMIGRWLKTHGEAIYGTERGRLNGATFGVTTRRGDTEYLLVHWWSGRELVVPDVKLRVRRARILASGQRLKFRWDGNRLILFDLPAKKPDPLCPVIVLKTEN